jgi:ferredoxin
MTWKVQVDPTACIASGMCVGLTPEHFRLTGTHATPTAEDVEPAEILLDAADSCPAGAITVIDKGEEIGPRP